MNETCAELIVLINFDIFPKDQITQHTIQQQITENRKSYIQT